MKKIIKYIILLILLNVITGCSTNNNVLDEKLFEISIDHFVEVNGEPEFNLLEEEGYENIDEQCYFTVLNTEESLDVFSNKTGVLYYGYPNCKFCRMAAPYLNRIANDNNISVYYVRLDQTTDEEHDLLIETMYDYLEKNDDGLTTFYSPTVIIVKDGKVVDIQIGVPGLTQEEENKGIPLEEKLEERYIKMFEKLK